MFRLSDLSPGLPENRRILNAISIFLGAVSLTVFGMQAFDKDPRPAVIVDCGDGRVAQRNGDFTQAAQAAGAEAGAKTGTDYHAIGTALTESWLGGGKTIQPGQEVYALVNADRDVTASGFGPCPPQYLSGKD